MRLSSPWRPVPAPIRRPPGSCCGGDATARGATMAMRLAAVNFAESARTRRRVALRRRPLVPAQRRLGVRLDAADAELLQVEGVVGPCERGCRAGDPGGCGKLVEAPRRDDVAQPHRLVAALQREG